MTIQIKKAVRLQKKFRGCLNAPSGAGKTYSALMLAEGLKNGGRVLVIDSERGSSVLYADKFDFDVLELPDHSTDSYLEAIKAAAGYDVVIIDSMSHAWEGVKEDVDSFTKRNPRGNTFEAWGKVGTPIFKKIMNAVLALSGHCIVTMRVKSDYIMEEYTDSTGKKKTKPVKVGLAPEFKAGAEYEFDLVANIDLEHNFIVEKTRIEFLTDKVYNKPTAELGTAIRDWLNSGAEAPKVESLIIPNGNGVVGIRPTVTAALAKTVNNANVKPGEGPWYHFMESGMYTGHPLATVPDSWMVGALAKHRDKLAVDDVTAIEAAIANPEGRAAAQEYYNQEA